MKILFTQKAWLDLSYWIENDLNQIRKINELIKSIKASPFNGIGHPEPLKHQLKGKWSRRIDHEHRLIYRISGQKGIDQQCEIIACRFHYK